MVVAEPLRNYRCPQGDDWRAIDLDSVYRQRLDSLTSLVELPLKNRIFLTVVQGLDPIKR
jgi:hypothetical protein